MPSGGSTRKGGGGGSGGNNPIPSLSQRQPKPLSINQRQASTISFLLNDREVSVIEEARTLLEQSQMEFRTQMLDAMHENAFVIWDSSHDEKSTSWGGVMTATAKRKKVKDEWLGKIEKKTPSGKPKGKLCKKLCLKLWQVVQ